MGSQNSSNINITDNTNAVVADCSNMQFLTFLMGDNEYEVDILRVQEIRGWENTTPIPNAPDYVKGVINLRGIIIPIVDLRELFSVSTLEYGPLTVVIVLKVHSNGNERIMGIVVDAVSDVFQAKEDDVKTAPDLGDASSDDFILGLVDVNDSMVVLLDIDGILGNESAANFNDVISNNNVASTN